MLTAMLILATAASAKAAEVSGGMSLISSELITAIFTGMAAVLGVIWQKSRNDKKLAEKDEEIKRIKAELPQPFEVQLKDHFVTRHEFDDMKKQNDSAHENIFGRLSASDQKLGNITGLLEGIRGDLSLIKSKLFRK